MEKEDEELLDAGIIFGTGFAPFRGGPMNYSQQEGVESITNSQQEGVESITNRMSEYETRYGERFSPSKGWSLLND